MLSNKNVGQSGPVTITVRDVRRNGTVSEYVTGSSGPKSRDIVLTYSQEGDHETPNPYTLETTLHGYPRGTNETHSVYTAGQTASYTVERSGFIVFTPPDVALPPDMTTYNMALSKLNERVRGSLDISVSLAQTSQMVRMFNVYKSAKQYALAADWRSIVKGVSGAWLEFTYGWKPLMSDVFSAAEELQRAADHVKGIAFSDRASAQESVPMNLIFQDYGTVTEQIPVSHRTQIKIRLYDAFDPTAARWTSLNPLSIAWELVPYSFVVDWFINIGGYMRDTETALLYASAFRDGFITRSSRINYSYDGTASRSFKFSDRVQTYTVKYDGFITKLKKTRTILHSYPLPNRPHVTADLSWRRAINAAALLTVLIEKAKK